jgi:hypothetical protein
VALKTDKGDLYLFQMYQEICQSAQPCAGETKASNAGFFFADTSWSERTLPYTVFAPSTQIPTTSITYNLFFLSDVSIGEQFFSNAKINLSFRSHTSKVQPLAGVGPNAYVNNHGTARVVITKGSQTISAEFAPGQLYVFFDPNTASVGFGSYAPDGSLQLAYPVSLTADFSLSPQLLEDVSDIIMNPNDAQLYSPETQALAQVTDLKHPTLLADFVTSCTAFTFNPATGIICSPQAQPPRLMTDMARGLYREALVSGGSSGRVLTRRMMMISEISSAQRRTGADKRSRKWSAKSPVIQVVPFVWNSIFSFSDQFRFR